MPKLQKEIDIVLEKYLTGFQVYSKSIDIYENPTKKEQKEARKADGTYTDMLRFIADGEKKRIWVWNAGLAIHSQAWEHISKAVNDRRQLYKDHELVSGELGSNGDVDAYYVVDWGKQEIVEMILEMDWTWADKYVTGFSKSFENSIKYEMRKKGWL